MVRRPGFVPTLDSVLCSSLGFRHQDLQWYRLLSWWHELTVACLSTGNPRQLTASSTLCSDVLCAGSEVAPCHCNIACASRVVPSLPGDGAGISTRFQASKAVISLDWNHPCEVRHHYQQRIYDSTRICALGYKFYIALIGRCRSVWFEHSGVCAF